MSSSDDDKATGFNHRCFSDFIRACNHCNPASSDSEPRITRLYKRFVLSAIGITLTFGTLWGASILTQVAINHSFSAPRPAEIQAHAHAQVFGWIGLLIMGFLYFAYPKFTRTPLQRVGQAELSFWLMTTGIILRTVSQPFASHTAGGLLVVLSSLLEILAGCLFVSIIYGVYYRAQTKSVVSDRFVISSMGWLMVALYLNFISMLFILRSGDPVISHRLNLSRMDAEVFGFIICMILAMAARLLLRLMHVADISRKAGMLAVLFFNAGVFAKVIAAPPLIGSTLIVTAVILYILGLDVFGFMSRSTEKREPFRIWVGTAFFWLVAGGVMMVGGDLFAVIVGGDVPHAWVGAYRHAVAVGFITTMAVGVAHCTVPVFRGTSLYSNRLMWAAFVLLQIGNTSRVIFQVFTYTKLPLIYAITGMSAYFELTALVLFGGNIILTFRRPSSVFLQQLIVRKTTTVGEFLKVFPAAKNELAELGLLFYDDSHISPHMTIKTASRLSGINIDFAVERLNKYVILSRNKPLTMAALF